VEEAREITLNNVGVLTGVRTEELQSMFVATSSVRCPSEKLTVSQVLKKLLTCYDIRSVITVRKCVIKM